jgi:leucyl-tRNA synthetase
LHPITNQEIPVWVADYVLMNYGTGAIMAVPAHDERDKEFAETFKLPIKEVVTEDGKLVNSNSLGLAIDGLPSKEGGNKIVAALEKKSLGEKKVTYKLRDWIFSRQRYWGEPIPVIQITEGAERGMLKLVPDNELPLELPKVEKYEPAGTGESPLVTVDKWINTVDPQSKAKARRESNTMPGSAGSSWYFLRYMDPQNSKEAWSPEAVNYWREVDLYIGGSEHAVGHLLYARFWHKVFFDMGLVPTKEPFKKLVHQGLMLGEDNEKMSKSRGNVVNPDEVIEKYGADTFRIYEMFMGPLDKAKPWQMGGIEGVYRFLSRYMRLCLDHDGKLSSNVQDVAEAMWPKHIQFTYHKTIKQVGEDIENLRYNTAVSALMIMLNELSEIFGNAPIPRAIVRDFTLMLAPFAPHVAEEVWAQLGNETSITRAAWPKFDATKVIADEIEIGIQVNGKLRESIRVSKDITEAELKKIVLGLDNVKKWMENREPKKFIYVKGRIASIVV